MRRLLLALSAAAAMGFILPGQASAQVNAANGFPVGGGFHQGGGFGGGGGWGGRGVVNRGVGWNRPGGYGRGWRGNGWRGGAWGGYPRYRYGGGYRYGGVAAGLATAATIGALATYPAYPVYPDYAPAYPVYPAYQSGPADFGDRCSTPVKMCNLYEPAQLGVGCSCAAPGGRARGVVIP